MIRHTILFKVKPNAQAVNKAIADFLALKEKLPGMLSIMGGECHFHEDPVKEKANKTFTHAISIDFKDEATLERFFNDPVTHPAKDGIVNIVEGGYDGIIGFEIK
ncbi:MAG: Dabb family protein [Gammaproteobacteria bacterium]|nr:Dabb family protein [Gammaproteobacteria bacterium]